MSYRNTLQYILILMSCDAPMNFQQDHNNENRLSTCKNAFLHQIRIGTIIDIVHDDIACMHVFVTYLSVAFQFLINIFVINND